MEPKKPLAPFILLSLAIHAGLLGYLTAPAARHGAADKIAATKLDATLKARATTVDPARLAARRDDAPRPAAPARELPAPVAARERSATEASPEAATKPVLLQGPSIQDMERLPSWGASKVVLTIQISEFGLVEKIESSASMPVPAETITGITKAFAAARFIPATQNSVPVKSTATITVTLDPSELYPAN